MKNYLLFIIAGLYACVKDLFHRGETDILPSFDKAASCGKVLDRIGQPAGMLYAGLTLLPAAKVTD